MQQAQQMIQGTGNDLESARHKANEIGLNSGFVNSMYQKYGNTPQAQMLCKLIGTSPDAIRDDALNLVGGSKGAQTRSPHSPASKKFPRLK